MKIISTILIVMLLAVTAPLMAQEDDFVDLNDYNLELTIEQKSILEEELKNVVDISGEIDLGMIRIILGELEKDDDEGFEEDYDESSDADNFGRGLAQRIKEYKANNENWTGQGLSNVIQNYKENNHPGNNNPGKGNAKSKNNPGKGN
jgi:hypothetical protein